MRAEELDEPMPETTPGPPGDRSLIQDWIDVQREVREAAIRLEDEAREAAIIDEEQARHEEWLADFQQSEAFFGRDAA